MNSKTRNACKALSAAILFLVVCGACNTSQEKILASTKSQVELRSFQQRAFDTIDREKTLRTIMATLQDLGFVLDNADSVLGTVTGTKLNNYLLRMTVTIRPRNDKQLLIRASAQYNITQVEDPQPYQDFFTSLSKAMFLEAHQVE
jgi:exosome complex RNA-binding protein Csl4